MTGRYGGDTYQSSWRRTFRSNVVLSTVKLPLSRGVCDNRERIAWAVSRKLVESAAWLEIKGESDE